jgi:hypothetical protein
VAAVLADALTAFAAGGAGLVAGELVRSSLLMRCPAPFAGNFPLAILIH